MNNWYLNLCCYFFVTMQLVAQNPLAVDNIEKALLKGANVVVRYENTKIHVEEPSKMIGEFSSAITVMNPKGKRFLDVLMYFDKDTKIKNLTVEYLDKNGEQLQKLSKSDYKNMLDEMGFH